MIVTEVITISGQNFKRTYSNLDMMIENDKGEIYSEAVDPKDAERIYFETDTPIPDDDIQGDDLVKMLEEIL